MIATLDRAALRAEARAPFGLDPDRPTLLVTGGSQGARRLNQSVAAAAPAFAAAGVQVLHVVGPAGRGDVPRTATGGPPYVVVPFVDRMDLAYAAADVVLCRAGATPSPRCPGSGLPGDLRAAADRQRRAGAQRPPGGRRRRRAARRRRRPHARVGARARCPALLTDPERLAAHVRAAARVIPLDADEKLADLILDGGGTR